MGEMFENSFGILILNAHQLCTSTLFGLFNYFFVYETRV